MTASRLQPALDVVKLSGLEQADHVARMKANPARHQPENIRIAERRMGPLRLAYFIIEWAIASPQRQQEILAYLASKGVDDGRDDD